MADVSKVRGALKKINEKVKYLLQNYNKMKYPQIRKTLAEIRALKYEIIEYLPDVLGLPFISVYATLWDIDRTVEGAERETEALYTDDDEVKRRIKRIKQLKETFEDEVNRHNPKGKDE